MKLIIFFAVASVAVMVVMVAQVVRQELNKHALKALVQHKSLEITRKEKQIADFKIELRGLKPKALSMTKMTEDMKTKKNNLQNEKKKLQEDVNTCNKDKEKAAKTKAETTVKLDQQKGEHEQAKQNAQVTIQDLKQKNLDRDKAICALVDTTNEEARDICGLRQ